MNNILIGISGGIAAYKICYLIRLLKKSGYNVKTVMTENAGHFITSETVETLTGNKCYTTLWADKTETDHINLSKWADILIIAPATANIIGKCANGIADDLLSTLYLSFTGHVLFCPAMNVHMYSHEAVQENLAKLAERDHILEPGEGLLACNDTGKGRMREPEEIMLHMERILYDGHKLRGKNVIITGGSLGEALDPVRHISNKSSGRMAASMIRAAYLNKAERIIYIHGDIEGKAPLCSENMKAENALHMLKMINTYADSNTVLFMAAAVSDFKPVHYSESKIKKSGSMNLELRENTDILLSLSNEMFARIGFALETDNGEENAKRKMEEKHLDYIVLNSSDALGSEDNEVTVIGKKGTKHIDKNSKDNIALGVIEWIEL